MDNQTAYAGASFSAQVTKETTSGNGVFTLTVIDSSLSTPYGVDVYDIDGDGDVDIVVADGAFSTGSLYWYDNDGSESFTRYTVSTDAAL